MFIGKCGDMFGVSRIVSRVVIVVGWLVFDVVSFRWLKFVLLFSVVIFWCVCMCWSFFLWFWGVFLVFCDYYYYY